MHDNSIDPWIKRRHDEQNCWSEGYNHVMGCDEVGRGALAGPCVAGAVILSPEFYLAELRDSKEATAKMRRTWTKVFKEKAVTWSMGQVEAPDIDMINIHKATLVAMTAGLLCLQQKKSHRRQLFMGTLCRLLLQQPVL
ncbi:MAG TPA: hypothetical protein VFC58_02125 [Desulfosporosinus sp.]|nr:hypothetical protein [Desulfosporosinus sp.]